MAWDYTSAIKWIVGLLKDDETLTGLVAGKVYRNLIPQGVAMPAVKLNLVSAVDRRFYDGGRALTVATIQVVGITQGDDLQAGAAIASAIDKALDKAVIRGLDFTAKIVRDGIVDLADATEGERFNMLGARYRAVLYSPSAG